LSEKVTFEKLIEKISNESHGVESLKEVKGYLVSNYKKTQQAIEGFLEPEILKEPIRWEDVKDKVWCSDETRNVNKFSFIQGDVLVTSKVLRLGTSEYNQDYDLWIVRSPSCDCVRGKFVRVSPIIEVVDKKSSDFNNFRTALYFSTPNRFPLPKSILDDGKDRMGYYADLLEPFFLKEEDKDDVVVLKSLSANGWHLLNAVSLNLESRANVDEELKFRT